MSVMETLMERCPVRRTRAQRAVFRGILSEACAERGYAMRETSSANARNYLVGDTESCRVIFLAHYDTPSRSLLPYHIFPRSRFLSFLSRYLPALLLCVCYITFVLIAAGPYAVASATVVYLCFLFLFCLLLFTGRGAQSTRNDNTSGIAVMLELMRILPSNLRSRAAFVFADGRDWKRTGAKQFSRVFAREDVPVIVLDCVGTGDALLLTRTRASGKDAVLNVLSRELRRLAVQEDIPVELLPPGKGVWYSDHRYFHRAMGVSLLHSVRGAGYALPGHGTERGTDFSEDMTYELTGTLRRFLEQIS